MNPKALACSAPVVLCRDQVKFYSFLPQRAHFLRQFRNHLGRLARFPGTHGFFPTATFGIRISHFLG